MNATNTIALQMFGPLGECTYSSYTDEANRNAVNIRQAKEMQHKFNLENRRFALAAHAWNFYITQSAIRRSWYFFQPSSELQDSPFNRYMSAALRSQVKSRNPYMVKSFRHVEKGWIQFCVVNIITGLPPATEQSYDLYAGPGKRSLLFKAILQSNSEVVNYFPNPENKGMTYYRLERERVAISGNCQSFPL